MRPAPRSATYNCPSGPMAMLRAVFRPLANTEMPKPDDRLTCPDGATTRVGAAVALGALVAVAAAAVGAARVAATVVGAAEAAAVTPTAGVPACATPVAVAAALGCELSVVGVAPNSPLAAQLVSTMSNPSNIQDAFIFNSSPTQGCREGF